MDSQYTVITIVSWYTFKQQCSPLTESMTVSVVTIVSWYTFKQQCPPLTESRTAAIVTIVE